MPLMPEEFRNFILRSLAGRASSAVSIGSNGERVGSTGAGKDAALVVQIAGYLVEQGWPGRHFLAIPRRQEARLMAAVRLSGDC